MYPFNENKLLERFVREDDFIDLNNLSENVLVGYPENYTYLSCLTRLNKQI